jgi:hypothetical protein
VATSSSNPLGVSIKTRQDLDKVLEAVHAVARTEVLVGFPEDTTERDKDPNDPEEDRDITNAALGYIHDNGVPERGIPARPFMIEGMRRAQGAVIEHLEGALKAAAHGKVEVAEGQMSAAGMAAKLSIQLRINEGIPPPLSEYTLRKRAARGEGSEVGKAAQKELDLRDKGVPPSVTNAKPLIDTGQMRNAVNYVIRPRAARRK